MDVLHIVDSDSRPPFMGSWWEPHSCARARPDFGSHDSPIYRQSQERAEAAGRDDAVRIYWPYLDYRGGECHYRPTEGVQQLPRQLSWHHHVCSPNLWLLSRDRPPDRKPRCFQQTVECSSE